MSEREEHREGLWCAELRCKRCYGADTWMQSEIPALRARVARLEGALGGLYVRCRAEGWLRRRDVVTEMDTARAVLQDAMQGVVTIAALAPDAARKEGV